MLPSELTICPHIFQCSWPVIINYRLEFKYAKEFRALSTCTVCNTCFQPITATHLLNVSSSLQWHISTLFTIMVCSSMQYQTSWKQISLIRKFLQGGNTDGWWEQEVQQIGVKGARDVKNCTGSVKIFKALSLTPLPPLLLKMDMSDRKRKFPEKKYVQDTAMAELFCRGCKILRHVVKILASHFTVTCFLIRKFTWPLNVMAKF